MNKRVFPLFFYNTFFTLGILFLLSSSLIIISYINTQRMLDKNMDDYFNQTLNITKIVLQNEQKELNSLALDISEHLYEDGNISKAYIFKLISEISAMDEIDLVFLKAGNTIVDFSYSLFDSKNIIEEIDKKKFLKNNNVFNIKIKNERFLILLNQQDIIDKNTGRIIAKFFVGKIVNDNFSLINNIREKSEIMNLSIFLQTDLVVTTTKNNNLYLNDFINKKLLIKKNTISAKKELTLSGVKIDIIFQSKNSSFTDLKNNYLFYFYTLFLILLIFVFVIYFLGNRVIVKPLSELITYAKDLKDDKNVEYNSSIKEYNELSLKLKSIIDELKEVQTQYSNAIEGVQDGFWDNNINKKEVFFSKRFKEMLGYEEDDDINNIDFWKKSIFKEDKKRTFHKLNLHLKNKTDIYEDAYRLKCKNGFYKWIRVRGKAHFDKDGKVCRITGFHTDIHEFKTLQKENTKNEIMLYQQSKLASMGEMIGNIAHQWRQPLNVISTISSSMQMQMHLGRFEQEEVDKNLDKINDTVEYLSEIIEKFRNFFNPNKKLEEFLLKDALLENIEIFESTFKKSELRLILDVKNSKIKGYKVELMQVLINLINNASDALSEHSIKNKLIFISSYEKNSTLFIELYDNALGIPFKIKDKIYEPYFSTKENKSGTGIGLYMSLLIIEKHFSGKITNDNYEYTYKGEKLIGEKFVIELPLD